MILKLNPLRLHKTKLFNHYKMAIIINLFQIIKVISYNPKLSQIIPHLPLIKFPSVVEIKNSISANILSKVMLSNHHLQKKMLSKKHLKNHYLSILNHKTIQHQVHQKFSIKMHHCQNHLNLWIKFQSVEIITINLDLNLMKNQSVRVTLTCLNFLKDNRHLQNKKSIQ